MIVTIPSALFKHFPILSPYDWVSTGPSLLRIYVKYSIAWFDPLKSHRLIPIHDGIVLLLYHKDDLPKFTRNHRLNKEVELREVLNHELRTEFPGIQIPEPVWIKPYLWNGKHDWLPNRTKRTHTIENVFVCGEAFSTRPYWIEGALESAETALQQINTDKDMNHPIEIKTNETL